MGMTNHPALQPVLTEGNVNMLVSYIHALEPEKSPDREPAEQAHFADGYRVACWAAARLVVDMWRAAEIATDACNQSMFDGVYLDAPTFEDEE